MRAIKHENGVELIPETEFERECLKHLAQKTIKAEFTDTWEQRGNLQLTFELHPWDRRG